MIGESLQRKMQPLKEAEDLIFRRWLVSGVLLLGAGGLVVMIWLAVVQQWFSGGAIFAFLLAASLLLMISVTLKKQKALDLKKLAVRIEEKHPDLQQALLTAVEQKAGADGRLGFLQQRVIEEVVDHAIENDWLRTVYRPHLLLAAWVQGFALINVGIMLVGLLLLAARIQPGPGAAEIPVVSLAAIELRVNPGDAEVERGQHLIVEANFEGGIPSAVEIVVEDVAEGAVEVARMKMKQGLQDGVFSGLISGIDRDLRYRIEFDHEQSESFELTTYVHPQLERADVLITPPAYTQLGKESKKDVRKVSVLEGSQLAFRLQINKAVVAAELYGEDEKVIPLLPSKADESILEAVFMPAKSQKYRVHLVDADDRVNKEPPWLKITVNKNAPPQLDLVFPKRDVVVSAVQELHLEAQVWDDLGVIATGVVLALGDKEMNLPLNEGRLAGGKKHSLKTLLAIEELEVKPRDLLSYYLWAEDRDAKGEVRRVMSDLFFAEVRHFEDIFREVQAMASKAPAKQGGSDKLVDLQKEVINATWKLIRRSGGAENFAQLALDVDVVKQSQQIVAEKVGGVLAKVKDQQIRNHLESAQAKMLQAVTQLEEVLESKKSGVLAPAMRSSRAAYEDLLSAQGREHQVTRSQSAKPGGGKQKMESQLMQLELKQQEKRYEKASEAKDQTAQTQQQKENLTVLSRLKELARRQEALAKKIKELENALKGANSDSEKDEFKKQLKRLQQQQLLRDLDDVTERMEQPQNRANMAEEKKKLEQSRENVREAAEALKKENLADAANAATRAQRGLDEVKEDFRQKTSRRFVEEMRAVRNQARELAKKQKVVSENLEQAGAKSVANKDPFRNQELMLEGMKIGRDLDQQGKDLAALLDEMKQISEDADGSEALLSTALYEAVRKAQTQGLSEALQEARDLGRMGRSDLAQESEGRAARGIDELQKKVEKAAGKVLGNEGDALRMARSELDDLLNQVKKEQEALREGAEKDATGGQVEKRTLTKDEAGQKKGEGKPGGAGEKVEGGKGGGKTGEGDGGIKGVFAGQEGRRATAEGMAGEEKSEPAPRRKGQPSSGAGLSHGAGDDRGRGGLLAGGPESAELFFDRAKEEEPSGPLTGKDYEAWTDRLRDVEEALADPKLRNEVAKVLDSARAMRIDHHRNNQPPQAHAIDKKIIMPLVELRDRVAEQLSRMDKKNPLAPIDRDPVPPEYKALVKKYYQELGGGR